MGQSLPNTILKEQAKYYIKRAQNPIEDASEINSCLHLTTMMDQMSLDISNSDYIISSITMNPLTFDSQVSQIFKKEYEIKCESKIIIKQENSPQKRNELLNGSFGSSVLKIQIPKHHGNQEEEENFTDMEYVSDNSMQTISKDFAKLKKDINQAEQKSFIHDDRFWQPNSSVPFILQPQQQSPKENQLFHRIVYKSQNQQDKEEYITNNGNAANNSQNNNKNRNHNNTNNNNLMNKKNIQQFSNKQFTTTIQPPQFNFAMKNHSSPQQSESMREKFNRLLIETQSNQKKQQYFNYQKPQTQKGKISIATDFATDTEKELVKQMGSPKQKNSKPPQVKYLEGTSYARKKQKFQSPQPQMRNVQHSPIIKSPNRLSSLEKAREELHSKRPHKMQNQELKQLEEKIEQLREELQGNKKIEGNVKGNKGWQKQSPIGLDAYQDYEGSIDLEKLSSYQESLN